MLPGEERQLRTTGCCMKFTLVQINNLITGNTLAAELAASAPECRRFVTVKGFEKNKRGAWQRLSRTINTDKRENAYFKIRIYELPKEFISSGWDVTEDVLTEDTVLDMIQGIPKLEETLGYYLDDFSALEPEWKCENPL